MVWPQQSGIVEADAMDWLRHKPAECARVVIFDPPYAVGTPVRGREDGAADPFAGSGNSRIATFDVGGTWEGCDIDPAFAEDRGKGQ